MNRDILSRLEKLNQLSLTEEQKEDILGFFGKQEAEISALYDIDTEATERMVHVMPIMTVVREDKVNKIFTREELQKGAPQTTDGYWQVPRLVE